MGCSRHQHPSAGSATDSGARSAALATGRHQHNAWLHCRIEFAWLRWVPQHAQDIAMSNRFLSSFAALLVATALPQIALADQVISIADGDTLTVLHERQPLRIRLANVDAPEKAQAWGKRSKQSLSDICFGKDAHYKVQSIDRYGRAVAVVVCDGVQANRAQVERGLAWVYTQYNKDSSLPALEAQAKAAQRGLWSDRDPVPPWTYRHAK